MPWWGWLLIALLAALAAGLAALAYTLLGGIGDGMADAFGYPRRRRWRRD